MFANVNFIANVLLASNSMHNLATREFANICICTYVYTRLNITAICLIKYMDMPCVVIRIDVCIKDWQA